MNRFEKAKGCGTITFNLKQLGIPSLSYINQIELHAVFIEEETSKPSISKTVKNFIGLTPSSISDLEAHSDALVTVQSRYFDVVLVEPAYYKPGLPTNVKVSFGLTP